MLLGMLSRLRARDTWLARDAPGNALSVEHSGHVAYSQCSRRVLSAWAYGTCGVLGRLPDGVSRLRHSGTCGSLRRYPGGGSRCGLREHVACSEGVPKKVLKGLSVGASGHKAYSEGKFEGGGFRRDLRDTWHFSKGSEEGFEGAFGLAFGTRGVLRRKVRR